MSLKHVAKHLTEQGRGPDDHLVHMSGREVAGLQALAMAHGGSLTINPKTGLPEAGFLDDILPVLAVGAGLYFGAGALGMLGEAGAATGAASTVPVLDAVPTLAEVSAAGGAAAPTAYTLQGSVLQPTIGAATGSGAAEVAAANAGMGATTSALGGGTASMLSQYGLPVAGGLGAAYLLSNKKKQDDTKKTIPMIRPATYSYNPQTPTNMIGSTYQPGQDTSERQWFNGGYTYGTPYEAADGGIIALAGGGPVENMSNNAAIGANTMYPMANMTTSAFATPYQTPQSTNMMQNMAPSGGGTVNMMSGEPNMQGTRMAMGGVTDLGGYSDGGRLLRGPGDGVSDSIPAQIGDKQPARLADGEFVVPARIVSELGNGSTEAGAKQLYKMLDRVQNARAKTTSKGKVAHNNNPAKLLPA
jgi:hypothetical protein